MNTRSSHCTPRFNVSFLTAVIVASIFQINGSQINGSQTNVYGSELPYQLPLRIVRFEQQVHFAYAEAEGLPSTEVLQIARASEGTIYAKTSAGFARFDNQRWLPAEQAFIAKMSAKYFPTEATWYGSLADQVSSREMIRDVTDHDGEIAVAAENGLYIGDGENWDLALPQEGNIRWAPVDVRAVAYDGKGQLWFACPQGVGFRVRSGEWKLFTGADGLPYNDFTCIATGPRGVWFGTTNGAIRYFEGDWEFRQGRRWLAHNHVRDIAVDDEGSAWFATPGGVSRIEFRPTTLSAKAALYEDEIDKHHRRTRLGFVNPAKMTEPADKETAAPYATDNDGHFMGLYLGAVSLGYAATKSPQLRDDAVQAFEALAFLSTVTEGGTHPAPQGFIARAIVPADGPNPNDNDNAEQDRQRRANRDGLWKVIEPRWPMDESGGWYWKCDSSSDELDGYFFGFGIYYDHVCETEQEKAQVQEVVRRMTDHLLDHNYSMVDHDGKPTRWGHFSPEDLNQNEDWWVERGLNSLSILTYLTVAHHVTGDPKYSVDTLKRYPFDPVDWPMSNAHRIDMLPLPDHVRDPGGQNAGKGFRIDGRVFRIDENHALYWGDDPWELTNATDGSRLREGVSFLLAYYMGLVHGFIVE